MGQRNPFLHSTWHCTTESCIKQWALADLKAVQAGTESPFIAMSHHTSVPQVLINETQWRRSAALQHRREDSIYVTDAGCWVLFSKATIPKAVKIKIRGEKMIGCHSACKIPTRCNEHLPEPIKNKL